MKAFESGKSYFCRSACDHNCIWTYTVVRRTEKSIWINDGEKVKRCAVKQHDDSEYVFPLGRYSMAPVLTAEKVA